MNVITTIVKQLRYLSSFTKRVTERSRLKFTERPILKVTDWSRLEADKRSAPVEVQVTGSCKSQPRGKTLVKVEAKDRAVNPTQPRGSSDNKDCVKHAARFNTWNCSAQIGYNDLKHTESKLLNTTRTTFLKLISPIVNRSAKAERLTQTWGAYVTMGSQATGQSRPASHPPTGPWNVKTRVDCYYCPREDSWACLLDALLHSITMHPKLLDTLLHHRPCGVHFLKMKALLLTASRTLSLWAVAAGLILSSAGRACHLLDRFSCGFFVHLHASMSVCCQKESEEVSSWRLLTSKIYGSMTCSPFQLAGRAAHPVCTSPKLLLLDQGRDTSSKLLLDVCCLLQSCWTLLFLPPHADASHTLSLHAHTTSIRLRRHRWYTSNVYIDIGPDTSDVYIDVRPDTSDVYTDVQIPAKESYDFDAAKETLSVELVKYCYGDRGIAGSSLVYLRKGLEEEFILREVFGGSVSSFVKIQRRCCFISCGFKRGVF
ncbi:hypothetical protein LR48_Vigan10g068400 [Vigna angularis]|uniref:Uncharacterized protein n=1 Tax=Phaseolus angularis TaxID=3914 RepID=A0A0L9VIQ4_PHAAN|nr:hypothetical protein LR48_Vigan10g068400 [Vigna angularis]